jgi:hypothetical protein
VTLTYAGASDCGPPSIVIKKTKDDPTSREVNKALFQLEANWYRNVAAKAPIKSAHCFGVFTDDADPTRFLLVLEDLTLVDGNEGERCLCTQKTSIAVTATARVC